MSRLRPYREVPLQNPCQIEAQTDVPAPRKLFPVSDPQDDGVGRFGSEHLTDGSFQDFVAAFANTGDRRFHFSIRNDATATHRLTHHPARVENQSVTPQRDDRCAKPVFSTQSRLATRLHLVGAMDTNNVRSGNLGMAVVPILVYMIIWLVLPWVAKG